MSEIKHTPEPWIAVPGKRHDPEVIITTQYRLDQSKGEICGMDVEFTGPHGDEQKANARRIVACVNACAGIDTELLEIIEDNDKTLAGVIANVEKQRDELLAAIEAIAINSEECLDFDECTAMLVSIDDYHKLMEAVARAKGEQ